MQEIKNIDALITISNIQKLFLKNVSYPSILMPINQAWSTKCTEKKSEEGLITKDGPKKNQKQIETRWK